MKGGTGKLDWTMWMVKEEILKIVDDLNLDRFPRQHEILKSKYGRKLYNAISRTGGIEYWSNILNLPYKRNLEYILYQGDEVIAVGTAAEIAKQIGVAENTIRQYGTKKRKQLAKNNPKLKILVRMV